MTRRPAGNRHDAQENLSFAYSNLLALGAVGSQ